jgi:hypothetical protein
VEVAENEEELNGGEATKDGKGGGWRVDTHDYCRVPLLSGAVLVGMDVGEDGVAGLVIVSSSSLVAEGCGEGDVPPW